MIPKTRKFPMRTEFLRFRSGAARQATPHTTVYSAPSGGNYSRLSVVVSARVSKLATVRNWVKRFTYDSLWPRIKGAGIDCVVVYKPLPLSRSSLSQDILVSELGKIRFVGKQAVENR